MIEGSSKAFLGELSKQEKSFEPESSVVVHNGQEWSEKSIKIQELIEKISVSQLGVIQNWIDQYKSDYVAHAVWNGNIEKVIKEGQVLPAEATLQKTKFLEYERGSTYGSRGFRELKGLTEKAKELFEILSFEEEHKLEELEGRKKQGLTLEESEELKILEQAIAEHLDPDEQKDFLDLVQTRKIFPKIIASFERKGLTHLNSNQQDRYNTLIDKFKKFSKEDRRDLKDLKRRKEGIYISFERDETTVKMWSVTAARNERLRKVYEDEISDPALNYYLQDPGKFYGYLTHKYEQWTKKEIQKDSIHQALDGARSSLLNITSEKLNHEIRTQHLGIRWSYGHCVLLRGNAKNIISDIRGGEAILLRPWENKGKYFALPLEDKDTILIGPKKDLELHFEHLTTQGIKFAYLESLTKEQVEFFKVPVELRTEIQRNKNL